MSDNRIDLANDLMNMNLEDVQTSFPLIKAGLIAAKVAEVTITPNKKGDGSNLKIKLVTTQVYPATNEGKEVEVQPGYPLFHQVSLVATEKYDPKVNLAKFMEGVLGTRQGSFMPLEQYLNRDVIVQVKHEGAPGGEYGIQARIDRFVKQS